MKNKRHEVIINLIKNHVLTTQDELQEALQNLGFSVTQSTVSRDIKELRIVKSQDENGIYRYHIATKNSDNTRDRNHFEEMFSKSCTDVVYSMNTVVIKCHTAMAQAACEGFDSLKWDGVVGTIAGENTIFILMRTEDMAHKLNDKLKQYIK